MFVYLDSLLSLRDRELQMRSWCRFVLFVVVLTSTFGCPEVGLDFSFLRCPEVRLYLSFVGVQRLD